MKLPNGFFIDNPAWPLVQTLLSFWDTTDADGNVGGTTVRCGALALEPSYANHALKILSGPAAGQTRDITTHPAGTDTVTVSDAFTNVAGVPQQITSGTSFVILSSTPTVAEVAAVLAAIAALQADVGDASASALGSLYAILGNPAQSFNAMVGYEGATALANKLTAARAALLDRLSIIAAGGAGELTVARATYLDNINNAQLLQITAARLGYIDLLADAINGLAAIKAEVEGLAGAAMRGTDDAALAASWTAALATILGNFTAARIGYLDNINQAGLLQVTAARAALLDQITAARLAELDAANLPADIDVIKADTPYLADASLPVSPTAGSLAGFIASGGTALGTQLPASKSLYDVIALDRWDVRLSAARAAYLDNLSGGAVALAASWTAALATALGNYTAARAGYLDNINQAGLLQVTAARAALLDQITALRLAELDAANIPTDLANIIGYVDLIDDVTNGLAAIKAEVEGLAGAAMRGTDSAALAASWTAGLATILGNFTVANIGYLANINQAGLLQVTAARAALLDQITAARLAELDAANIPADTDSKVMGRLQIKATTIDLNQIAGSYDLFTATTQDVVVESLVIRMSGGAIGGAVTSISIQTDDATPIVLIDAVAGLVANLTDEAQLAWTGAMLLDAGTSAKIRLTIAGGAAGVARVCDVVAEHRAVVSGGYLA